MSKILLIMLIFIFGPLTALADFLSDDCDQLIEDMDSHKARVALYPQRDFSQSLRSIGSSVLDLENFIAHNENGGPSDRSNKLRLENRMDFLKDECQRDSTSSYCSDLTRRLAKYKAEFGTDYVPKAVSYPEMNLTNHTYTLPNGRTYNLRLRSYATDEQ